VSGPKGPGPENPDEIEITPEMIEAAERALWEQAAKFNIVTLDEMHQDTVRLMLAAALSKFRTS
jgi:hypothetical protein